MVGSSGNDGVGDIRVVGLEVEHADRAIPIQMNDQIRRILPLFVVGWMEERQVISFYTTMHK